MERGCQYPIGTFEELIFDIVSKIITSNQEFQKIDRHILGVWHIFDEVSNSLLSNLSWQ
jgi:hypothetical protein